jgi:hypothetical protein
MDQRSFRRNLSLPRQSAPTQEDEKERTKGFAVLFPPSFPDGPGWGIDGWELLRFSYTLRVALTEIFLTEELKGLDLRLLRNKQIAWSAVLDMPLSSTGLGAWQGTATGLADLVNPILYQAGDLFEFELIGKLVGGGAATYNTFSLDTMSIEVLVNQA